MCKTSATRWRQRHSSRETPVDTPYVLGPFLLRRNVTCVRTYKLNNWAYLQKFSAGWGPESMTSNNRTEEETSPCQSPSWKQSRAGVARCYFYPFRVSEALPASPDSGLEGCRRGGRGFPQGQLGGGGSGGRRKRT